MNSASAKPLAVFLLILAAGSGIAGFVLRRHSAPLFQSSAAVRVVRDKTDLEQLGDRAPAGLDTAVFFQNEADLLRSDTVLRKVVERLELNREWGNRFNDGQVLKTGEAVEILKAWLVVSPEPTSALLRIRMTSDNSLEATQLADAVVAAYCDYRVERRHRIAQDAMNALKAAYEAGAEKARLASNLVEQARQALDPAVRDQNPPPQLTREDAETLRVLSEHFNRAKMVHMVQSNQLANSAGLPPSERQKLTANVVLIQADLSNAETALQAEAKRQEALRTYWSARQELDQVNLLFGPVKKPFEENQRDLGSLEVAPASVAEPASAAVALPATKARAAQGCLLGAGVLLVASAGLFVRSRKPVVKA